MPILQLDIVGDALDYPQGLAQRVADAAAVVLSSRPGGTWVKISFCDSANYAENGGAAAGYPMLVSLLQAEPSSGDAQQEQIAALAQAIAHASGHPLENIHILVEPAAKGRIAFGGRLQR